MNLTHTLAVLFAAGLPLGLIIIKLIAKTFAKSDMQLGKVTSICTNVIGSLTKSNLEVQTIYYDDHLITISSNQEMDVENLETKEKVHLEKPQLLREETLLWVARTSALCHYKKMHQIEEETNRFLASCGFSKNRIISQYQIIDKLETDKKKKISTVVAKDLEDKNIYAFSKGNPYKILKKCRRLQVKDQKIEITPTIHRRIKRRIDKLNKKGQKVIAFAYKGLPRKQYQTYEEDFTESDLILTGIFAFINPINDRVSKSIQKAKENDIKIYIVTGTQEKKAAALGIKLEIINPNYFENITGSQLHDIPDKKLSKMLANKEKDYVFSEMKESEKRIIFEALRKNGETIALTDKNDEESLGKLLDKIIEGRNFHEGFKKCIYHNLSLKVAELFFVITALLTGSPIALTLTSILLIEILVNVLLGLSLKAERTPHKYSNKNSSIIIEGIFIGALLSIVFIWNSLKYGWSPNQSLSANSPMIFKSSTMIFISITLIQIYNAYRLKNSGSSITSNLHLFLSTIILILCIYAFTTIETFSETLGFTKVTLAEWQIIAFILFSYILIQSAKNHFKYAPNTEARLPEDQSDTEEQQE